MQSIASRALTVGAVLVIVAGCGGATSGSPGAGASGPPPTSAAVPSSGPVGSECAAIPTYSPDNPAPSFPIISDPALEAKFPAQIDGQPLAGLSSARWLDTLCLFGGQAGVNALRTEMPVGLDLLSMSIGGGKATVDGEEVRINAFRTPGVDGSVLLQNLSKLAAQTGTDSPKFDPADFKPAVVGGKNVTTYTGADGVVSYIYVSGDTVIIVDGVTESQANKIFAAFA